MLEAHEIVIAERGPTLSQCRYRRSELHFSSGPTHEIEHTVRHKSQPKSFLDQSGWRNERVTVNLGPYVEFGR